MRNAQSPALQNVALECQEGLLEERFYIENFGIVERAQEPCNTAYKCTVFTDRFYFLNDYKNFVQLT